MSNLLPLSHRAYGDPGSSSLPILLIHGLFGSAVNWHPIVGRLQLLLGADRRLIVPDLRNHGDSPHHPLMSYEAMAGDVIGLLDSLGIGRAALVGHSLGGKVAMWLALTRPERVEALAVVDIAPVDYPARFKRLIAALQGLDLQAIDSRRDADTLLAGAIPDPALRGFLLHNLRKTAAGWVWRTHLAALPAAMAGLMTFPEAQGRQFPGPVRFIYGAASDYVAGRHLPAIRALFPLARLRAIPGAGHWVHADQPEAFVRALADVLADRHSAEPQ